MHTEPLPPDVRSLLELLHRGEQDPKGLSPAQRNAFDYCKTRTPEWATLGFKTPVGIKRIRRGTPNELALLAGAYGGLRIFITDEGKKVLADARYGERICGTASDYSFEPESESPAKPKARTGPRRKRSRAKRTEPTVEMTRAYKSNKAGLTYRAIGKELGKSHETIRQWVALTADWYGDNARSVRANQTLPDD